MKRAAGLLHAAAAAALVALGVTLLRLAGPVAWDVRLPTAVFVLFPLGLLALAWLPGRRALALLRDEPAPGGARLAASSAASALLIAGVVWAFAPISLHYAEPGSRLDPGAFDRGDWPRFDPESWAERAPVYRAQLRHVLGPQPARLPPRPKRLTEENRGDHLHRVYEMPVERSGVPAWDTLRFHLLVPADLQGRPAPVVIVHHQHAGRFDKGGGEPVGVRGDPRQAIGLDLVHAGFVVAAPDAVGFASRREHGERFTAMRLLMQGRALAGKYAWDVSRLVDALGRLPEVDAERIGIAGHSLGGWVAIVAAALDPRLRAVASSCGFAPLTGRGSLMTVPTSTPWPSTCPACSLCRSPWTRPRSWACSAVARSSCPTVRATRSSRWTAWRRCTPG